MGAVILLVFSPRREWRNWQTRQLEVLVGVKSRGGSSPLLGIQDDPGRKAGVVVILGSCSTWSCSATARSKTRGEIRWPGSGVDPAFHRRFGRNDGDQWVEGQDHGIEIITPRPIDAAAGHRLGDPKPPLMMRDLENLTSSITI